MTRYTNGIFTVADSNSLLSHKEIFPIALENKHLEIFLGNFHFLIMEIYIASSGDSNV